MARTGYITIPAGQEELYRRALQQNDRFVYNRVIRQNLLLSRKRKKGLTQRSLLPQISEAWAGLSAVEKEAWTAAGAECNLNGWRLFVQDMCLRIKNDIAGVATPSTLHQSLVGQLHIEAPATEIKIAQYHPRSYWVSQKIVGRKAMYEPVVVTEDFSLPLALSLNYKSNLTSQGAGSFAKFYAEIWHSYQGADLFTTVDIDLDLVSDWKNDTANVSSLLGYVVGYNLYFHLYNLRGDLFIDNVKATHSGQNWVRDPFCKDIEQAFTRAFYQVPKHWVAVTLPEGSDFDSIYPT
jgi:hypothetical protein